MPGPSLFLHNWENSVYSGVGYKFAPIAAFFAERYPLFQAVGASS